MSWQYKYMVTVEGIKVNYDPCEHCGSVPTDQEIKDQLAIIERNSGGPCVVCGEKGKVIEISIYHYKTRDADRWGGDVTLSEPMEKLNGYWNSQAIDLRIHPRCAAKALPKANIPI